MRKGKNFLNIFMGASLGCYIGHCIFVLWNHHRHPEVYGMQSAPWYTSIWVNGLMVLAIMLICTMIKMILKYMEKRKSPE